MRAKYRELKKIWQMVLPTETHKKIWKNFKVILDMKNNFCAIFYCISELFNKLISSGRFAAAQKLINARSPTSKINFDNAEYILNTLAYLESTLLAIFVIMIIASFW